jgi:GR25 family glycosyltransferase involved in LPS biosynthesis
VIKEVAVTLSHIKALYMAVTSTNKHPYAFIMEDDLQLVFDVDFDVLIQQFPPDFGIVQTFVINNNIGRLLTLE